VCRGRVGGRFGHPTNIVVRWWCYPIELGNTDDRMTVAVIGLVQQMRTE
jgi:hypothetical protein